MRVDMQVVGAAAVVSLTCFGASAQEDIADFYKGKTVQIIVGTSAGGGYDIFARALARHMGRHVPGAPKFIVANMPGAGSNVMSAHVVNAAPKDGSVIGAPFATQPLAAVFENVAKLRFDPRRLHYLGSATTGHYLCVVRPDAPATRLADMMTTELVMGGTAENGSTGYLPILLNNVIGTKFKVVLGYRGGGDMFLAMENGEAFGRVASWDSWTSEKPDWLRDGRLVHLVQYGPLNTEIPDVPSLSKLLDGENDRRLLEFLGMGMTLGRAFYMPPGNNGAPQKELEAAFAQMLKDTSFVEGAKSLRMAVEPRSGAEISEALKRAYNVTPGVLNALKQLIAN